MNAPSRLDDDGWSVADAIELNVEDASNVLEKINETCDNLLPKPSQKLFPKSGY